MKRKKLIIKGVFKTIGYLIGLLMFVLGCIGGILPAIVIGLLLVGLQYGISFYKKGKRAEDKEDVAVYQVNADGSYHRVGGWKKFVLALIGCIFGIVATPVDIIKTFKAAADLRPGPKGIPICNYASYGDGEAYKIFDDAIKEYYPDENSLSVGFFFTSKISEEDAVTLLAEMPENVEEVFSKIDNISLFTALHVAALRADEKKEFFDNYPNNVQSIRQIYPNLNDESIIQIMCSNQTDKEKQKSYKRANK